MFSIARAAVAMVMIATAGLRALKPLAFIAPEDLTMRTLIVTLALIAGWTAPANAQTAPSAPPAGESLIKPKALYVPDKVESKRAALKDKDFGWDGSVSVGASTAVSQSSSVVGRIDGTSFTFGTQIKGGLLYTRDAHEWRNALAYGLTYSRTPALAAFVKTNDELALESIYLYHVKRVPWLGPFGRVNLNLPFFAGSDLRSASEVFPDPAAPTGPTLYRNKADQTDVIETGDAVFELDENGVASLRLSDPFLPVRLRETVGLFAAPLDKPQIRLEVKLGFDARQTFADGQLAIEDDATDADGIEDIDFVRLEDVFQAGPSLGIEAVGELAQKRVVYLFLAEAMLPAVNNQRDSSDLSLVELTNLHFEANLSFKLVSWASLDYQFKTLYEPQLLEQFQVQNNLLLTFAYTLIEAKNGG